MRRAPEEIGGEETSGVAVAKRCPLGSLRILVAEDNLFNQQLVSSQLAKLGYRADFVTTGTGALKAMESGDYHVTFMDCHMAELDGYQATAALRKSEGASGGRRIVVAMTTDVLEGSREKCRASGMDDYIAKPAKVGDLKRVIERWLEAPPVDFGILREATEGDEKAFEKLKGIYFTQAAAHLDALGQAIQKASLPEIERLAHALAGSSDCFGAVAMSPLLHEIQFLAQDAQLDTVPTLFRNLLIQFDRLKEFFNHPA